MVFFFFLSLIFFACILSVNKDLIFFFYKSPHQFNQYLRGEDEVQASVLSILQITVM